MRNMESKNTISDKGCFGKSKIPIIPSVKKNNTAVLINLIRKIFHMKITLRLITQM